MSEQIFKTQQNYKRVNKAKLQFQLSYAVYYKQPRSSREGKPFPYVFGRYIQDGTLKPANMESAPTKTSILSDSAKLSFIGSETKTKINPIPRKYKNKLSTYTNSKCGKL